MSAKIGVIEDSRSEADAHAAFSSRAISRPVWSRERLPTTRSQWETRTASIGNDKGAVIFEQRDVEVPADWSQTATNIVASKYFHGKLGSPERETSVGAAGAPRGRHHRRLGQAGRLLRDRARTRENFRDELAHLMLHQKACFNSPVWFNVGVKEARGYGWYYDEATDSDHAS